jgi:hypothetical protein
MAVDTALAFLWKLAQMLKLTVEGPKLPGLNPIDPRAGITLAELFLSAGHGKGRRVAAEPRWP